MSSALPGFLRRPWRLFEARRALLRGDPDQALDHLRDPCLALSPGADDLRGRALEALFRLAAHKLVLGRDRSVARLLDIARLEAPERAVRWQQNNATLAAEGPPPDVPERLGRRVRGALSDLLQEMKSGAPEQPEPSPPRAASESVDLSAPPGPEPALWPPGRPLRFHLAVDDGGEFLCVAGGEVLLGHSRAERADLPFLADLDAVHARFRWEESFHGGPSWSIAPERRARVEINGRRLESPANLIDGDELRLADNLSFYFRTPEQSSSTALLELRHGAECAGAVRVLLFGPGVAGRVRIGPSAARHIPVADLDQEVELSVVGGKLRVACPGGVRLLGAVGSDKRPELFLPCPPPRRLDLWVAARPADRPPFGLSLTALESGAPESGEGGRDV